ncbi:MAG: hypothetical protein AAGB24_14450, partial [Bacteroidota bacterium]
MKSDGEASKIDPLKKLELPDISFVDPQFLMSSSNIDLPLSKNRIEYNPCTNHWQLYVDDETKESLNYSKVKDKGLTFIISPINTLKYDVTVSKSFVVTDTEVPSLFSRLYDEFAMNEFQRGETENTLGSELAIITKLNNDLKKFLESKTNIMDCAEMKAFPSQREAILKKINHYGFEIHSFLKRMKFFFNITQESSYPFQNWDTPCGVQGIPEPSR